MLMCHGCCPCLAIHTGGLSPQPTLAGGEGPQLPRSGPRWEERAELPAHALGPVDRSCRNK